MSALYEQSEYSFEHGIDHCGYAGVAPILYVGGPVSPQDFVERELAGIRGVSVSQGGLPRGTKWAHLNMALLFEKLPKIEFLRIEFDDTVCIDDLGAQPNLTQLILDCPKVRGTFQRELSELRSARIRCPDECTTSLVAPKLEKLEIIRPRFDSLLAISHLTALRELGIFYARNLRSLSGLEQLPNLQNLRLRNCPNLVSLDTIVPQAGPREVVIDSCVGFTDGAAAFNLASLEKLCFYAGENGPQSVRLPKFFEAQQFELEVRGMRTEWI